MNEIRVLSSFEREFKKLGKKYKGITKDLANLFEQLAENPFLGDVIPNTNGARKVRMAISAKNKGKSGGARVITYVLEYTEAGDCEIWLLSIYDKSELENVSQEFITQKIAEALAEEIENDSLE
ncbi:MAG: type II toxin-antitoxin system RelE family toxin [Bacteroidia bacterium]